MPFPSFSQELNNLASTTLWLYATKKAVDNIFRGTPLLQEFQARKAFVGRTGGTHIRVPLEYGTSPVLSIDYKEAIRLEGVELVTTAIYPWKYMAAPLLIYEIEMKMNSGEGQILDLLDIKVRNIERSFREKFNELMYLDGSGNGGKDIDGLGLLVSDTTTCGGLNPTTYTWWKSYVDSTAEAISFAKLSKAITAVTYDKAPDIIVMPLDLWDSLHNSLPQFVRYSDNQRMANWGFPHFVVRGGIPVVADRYAPSGKVWVLNLDTLKVFYMNGYLFQPRGFVDVPNLLASANIYLFVGNMVTTARRCNGVLTNKTA